MSSEARWKEHHHVFTGSRNQLEFARQSAGACSRLGVEPPRGGCRFVFGLQSLASLQRGGYESTRRSCGLTLGGATIVGAYLLDPDKHATEFQRGALQTVNKRAIPVVYVALRFLPLTLFLILFHLIRANVIECSSSSWAISTPPPRHPTQLQCRQSAPQLVRHQCNLLQTSPHQRALASASRQSAIHFH